MPVDPKRYLSHEKHHQEDLSGGTTSPSPEQPGFSVREEEVVEDVTSRLREPETRGDDYAQAYGTVDGERRPRRARARPRERES